ncbi:MAG: peroxiredoxin family protein [Gaiellaceae bacterium]
MSVTAAPEFELPSVGATAVRLSDIRQEASVERVVLLFAHADCPTARLTLRRLGPHGPALLSAGTRLVVVAEESPAGAARLARSHGVDALVLAQETPWPVSELYGVESVPTIVAIDREGTIVERVEGWNTEALEQLLGIELDGSEPRWKPGCGARTSSSATGSPVEIGDALEDMFERGWTDGLPVVPPTPDAVERMLGGRPPQGSLGPVPPAMGEATLERVAACAVLAGCQPEYFPVVLAAVECVLDPAFNVHGQAVTTSPPGQILIVNGPIRDELGFNSGMGALAMGARANLTIGRAVRLVVHLTGGATPSSLDRAALGHPGKLSFCIAENEEASPWEPFHVERGFRLSESAVSVMAGDAPASISDHRSTSASELAATIGWGASNGWSPFMWPMDGNSLFVISPEHARMFAEEGWSKNDLRQAIFAEVKRPAGELNRGETTPTVENAEPDELISKWPSAARIQIIVAGGEAGRFSAVIGPSMSMDAELLTRVIER